jgi:hypothetical protein
LYLYNIKIQTNIDQNTVKKIEKSQIFFEIIFFEEFVFFRAGPSPAHMAGLDPTSLRGWAGPSQPNLVIGFGPLTQLGVHLLPAN